jgi:cbb3-type cytochrome oxidase subunit 3
MRLDKLFISSSIIVLALASFAKLVSATGRAEILDFPDPLLGLANRLILYGVAFIELGVMSFLFFSRNNWLKSILIAWLSSCFILYHFGLWLLHPKKLCPCFGNLTEALHIPPQTADTSMKIILAYLLIGSYTSLFWLWRQSKKTIPASLPPQ